MNWLAAAGLAVVLVAAVALWPRRARADETPYADMSNTLGTVDGLPVRGRLVMEVPPIALDKATPIGQSSQAELRSRQILLRVGAVDLGACKADDEGYLDCRLEVAGRLAPGNHTVEVVLDDVVIGQFRARVLAADFSGLVVRSDLDKTYLDTAFTRKRDIARLLVTAGPDRVELPGMDAVFAALRAGPDGRDTPIVFLSGSPRFFKRTLESKLAADGVEVDGLFLKPFKEIAARRAWEFAPSDIVPSLKEQIGYKLLWLLRARLEIPPGARELLLGDDSEADYVIYALYHRLLAGEFDPVALDAELSRLGVGASFRAEVSRYAPDVVRHVGGRSGVVGIYINRTGSAHGPHRVEDWLVTDLTRVHDGAWPLVLDLVEEGFVARSAVVDVEGRMTSRGVSAEDREAAAAAAVTSGYLTR